MINDAYEAPVFSISIRARTRHRSLGRDGSPACQARARRVRGNAEVDGRGCLGISMFLSGPRIYYPSPSGKDSGGRTCMTTWDEEVSPCPLLKPFFKEAVRVAGIALLANRVL